MTDQRTNKATVDDPGLQGEFRKGFGDGQTDDSATTDDVVEKIELTVEDLMVRLGEMPADATVALIVHGTVAEVFDITFNENSGWVLLEG